MARQAQNHTTSKTLGLGIESTAHTFSCAIMEKKGYDKGRILSDVRHIYKPDKGEGIHPREASRHHVEHAPYCTPRLSE